MTFFFISISIVIIQRIVELFIARSHSKEMFEMGAVEYDSRGYRFIVIMHICFFASLIIEFLVFNKSLNLLWYIFTSIFILAQILRYWAIESLGVYWNTRIIILKESPLIKSGPYKYLNHPNYVAVSAELASLPLIFSCYFTFIIFTVLNFFILRRRIRIETSALSQKT